MRYESAGAFRMALEQRLKTEAARIGLKGALALDFRLGGASRPTKDIDLGRDDDEKAAIEDITAAQRLHLDDFFTFMASRTDAFDEVDEFQAIRFRVRAELAGRVFEQFVVDIGFAKPAPSSLSRGARSWRSSRAPSSTASGSGGNWRGLNHCVRVCPSASRAEITAATA